MTIMGLLLRFFLVYLVAIIGAGYLFSYLEIKASGINIAILIGCIIWLCGSFGKKNGRYFTGNEKTAVILGILVIDIAYQLIFGIATILYKNPNTELKTLAISTALVGFLHLIVIYFIVGSTKKMLIKQGAISD